MILAASAVGIAFDIPHPSMSDVYPTSVGWVLVVLAIGSVVAVCAIMGFKLVSQFSSICVPWITKKAPNS